MYLTFDHDAFLPYPFQFAIYYLPDILPLSSLSYWRHTSYRQNCTCPLPLHHR